MDSVMDQASGERRQATDVRSGTNPYPFDERIVDGWGRQSGPRTRTRAGAGLHKVVAILPVLGGAIVLLLLLGLLVQASRVRDTTPSGIAAFVILLLAAFLCGWIAARA